jgi:hypothetical protein
VLYRLARRRRRTSKTDRNAEQSKVEEGSDLAKTSNLT